MIIVTFALATAFLVCILLIPVVIKVSMNRKIYSLQGGRRIHKKITPSFGGIGIFCGIAIAIMLWTPKADRNTSFLFLAVLSIPFLIGFLDDLYHLRPRTKIFGQWVATTLIFFVCRIQITSTYGLLDYSDPLSPALSYILTLATVIIVTNSFNLIDGIDGLAGTFSMFAMSCFGIWFFMTENYVSSLFCLSFVGALVAFLFYNWEPSKIFMGDTGSLLIGMTLSILAIEFLNKNSALPVSNRLRFECGVSAALSVLILPLVDTVRVIVIRAKNGISPLMADKRHIHHALVRIGYSHRFAVAVLSVIHIAFVSLVIALQGFSDWIVIPVVIGSAIFLCILLDLMIRNFTTGNRNQSAVRLWKKRLH